MPIIQTSFLLNFKTGNIIFDTFIAIILLHYFKIVVDKLPKFIVGIKNCIFKKRIRSEYLIQGTVTISTEYCSHSVNFPVEYKAVMFKINKKDVDIMKGKQFNCFNTNPSESMFSYSLNTANEIILTKDIMVRQMGNIDKSNDLKSSIEFYNLYVYSYVLPFNKLKKCIDKWVKDYKRFIKENNDGNTYYFSYLGSKFDENKITITETNFETHLYYSNKNFNNIFFEGKDTLVKRLDYFVNCEEHYSKLGIPYTFGLLFHGKPGCGKTSTIKAIANYTNRHIIEIPLSKIKTCAELKNIFFKDIINNHYLPANKKIIVLEDIDCMGDIVQKRSVETVDKKNKNIKRYKNKIYKVKNADNSDQLTLSYILNLIDGILEQRGRILIITTNYPEKLDDALLRPGRIDIQVNFKKCNKDVCRQIIEFYFNDKLKEVDINRLQEGLYTPAEVFQKCFNLGNIEEVLDACSK